MVKCLRCGKKITDAWYWYRRTWSGVFGEGIKLETYCDECAACMIDDHTNNGLLCAKAE